MKIAVEQKRIAGQRKLRAAMKSFDYRRIDNRLERMARIVVDGVVRITDAINSMEFSRKRIKNAVRALRSKRLVSKVGRPQFVIGDKEQIVLDEIIIESRSGSCLPIRKVRELMENVINDTDDEDAPYVNVSMATAYQFVKRHPELKRSSPKNVDVNRLAVSCQSVLQPWYSLLDGLHEKNEYCKELIFNMDESSLRVPTNSKLSVVHPKNENPGFRKEPPKMANSTLVAAVAADGFALPSVILWPSKSLPDEMKPLLSQTLDIWPNGSGWMGCNQFKKYALSTLLQGIIDRRKRMSLENSRCLLLIDSHISRADPTIWREFQKENIDVITFIPYSTHIAQPLDRGVFAVLKTELQTKYEPPSSSTSSSKRTALVDVLPQAIHTALSPAVIKKPSQRVEFFITNLGRFS
ncbi:uncharacterized protein MONOS_5658 [Monocercomonoides exilis]|uniref:uncharacterized protein n=1 Tax=Monocercomonoides exilis TaxID=2049356 RepID=UPI003559DD34|nr:hypothetical protein MONOS_5658 [Monocercomonoides exilis]|eukprot:MONOS_5658.1-p1 / transcript=MONOS_5658.1 / gene=MONOS_5658 / organism=Monocercomonoides_exilis_PA203 / gene_product=unspecified product / transcript_product=unspecified product / location=Mono_scaffold00167:68959-70229(-) / protein_length=408 / sequence_SO=supercontig / SO=protein_coding / is_pseudo=false